jgi:hypothetical protein
VVERKDEGDWEGSVESRRREREKVRKLDIYDAMD